MSELRRMNDELENQKGGDNYIKDSASFKKQYAAVLLQLNEVNEQAWDANKPSCFISTLLSFTIIS